MDIVPRQEALNKMADSIHCLLSIGNLNPNQLPSKIIEYLSTGKPVIHFAELENDPVYDLESSFNNLLIITNKDNISEIEDSVNNLFSLVGDFNEKLFINNFTPQALIKLI